MSGSNQYPRLPWERDFTARRAFIARPHERGKGCARIWYAGERPEPFQWAWMVHWPGRFSRSSGEPSKQAAADAATVAYWDFMEETAGWKPPPPVYPPAPHMPAVMILENVRRWLTTAKRHEAMDRLHLFMRAAIHGPTISGSRELDKQIWAMLGDNWQRLPRYGEPDSRNQT